MRKIAFLIFLSFLLGGKAAWAGGSCPTGSNYWPLWSSTSSFPETPVTLSALGVTNCYYAAATGSDSNSGTSESSPWLHFPGMPTCTGNCAALTPSAGMGFIFRGGDTWSVLNFVWDFKWSGTSTNYIFIGYDPTWYSGSAWARPIFNLGLTTTWGSNTSVDAILTGSYVIFDNFEGVGLYETSSFHPNFIATCTYSYIQDVYFHGWGHDSTLGTSFSSQALTAGACNGKQGTVGRYNYVDGSDTDKYQMYAFGHPSTPQILYGNFMEYVASGANGSYDIAHDNLQQYFADCGGTGCGHQDAFYLDCATGYTTYQLFYDNVARHNTESWMGGAVKFYLNGDCFVSSSTVGYAFDNVMYDNYPGNQWDTGGHFGPKNPTDGCAANDPNPTADCNYGKWYIFSNTTECGTDGTPGECGLGDGGNSQGGVYSGGVMTLYLSNNHWIQNTTATPLACNYNSPATFTCTQTTDLEQLLSTANSQGYSDTTTYAFQPTNSSGSTVHAGTVESICPTISAFNSAAGLACGESTSYACSINTTNHTVSCTAATPVSRGSSPDIGAYQYSGTPTVATPTFSPAAGSYSSAQSVTISVSSPSGATIYYCQDTTNTCTPSTTYSSAVSVTGTGYLRAYGTYSGYTQSATASAYYQIGVVGGATSTITWTTTHQTMDGWGGEDWVSAESLTSAQADIFFSPTAGIGLEFIRTQNYGCPATTSCSVSTSNVPDLTSLQEAVARGAKVWLLVQPPAQYQVGGNFQNGTPGSDGNCVASSNYTAFANFTVSWIQMLNSNSATVSYLSIANEPDLTGSNSLGACQWTAAGLDAYVKVLGPALSTAGLSSIQLDIADVSNWFSTDRVSTCLNDSSCSEYISIAGAHDYGLGSVDGSDNGYCCATATAPPSSTSGKKIWMTEVNGGLTYNSTAGLWSWDTSIADAMIWAHNIHDFLTIPNMSGYSYWQLADCCASESGAPFNDGLTDASFDLSARYYVVGNWSKFVRSGWIRIDSTINPQPGVYVTAFKNPAGTSYTIVAVNTNTGEVGSCSPSPCTSQTFYLSGFPSTASVTPYVTTSASSGLVQQSAVGIASGSFTYALPAQSVTTFTGTTSSSSVNVIQHTSAVCLTNATSCSATFLNAVSKGDYILVGGADYGAANLSLSFSDGTNTYTHVNFGSNGYCSLATDGDTLAMAYAPVTGSSQAYTVTVSDTTSSNKMLLIAEVTGLTGFDKSSCANPQSGTTGISSGNTATTSQANEFLFGFMGNACNYTETITAGSGYALLDAPGLTGCVSTVADEYQTVTATGAYAATFNQTTSEESAVTIATFTQGASGSPTVSLTPTSASFSTNKNTTSAAQQATYTNTGTANLVVSAISTTGPFSETSTGSPCSSSPPWTLTPTQYCVFNITYSPTTTGNSSGSLSITDNSSTSPESIALSGMGTAPSDAWAPTSYAFGNVTFGSPVTTGLIYLQNSGNGPSTGTLSFTGSNPSYFTLASTSCGTVSSPSCTVAAGSSISATITFSPTSGNCTSGCSANLTWTDSAQSITQNLGLTGTGVAALVTAVGATPSVPVSPATVYFITGPINVQFTSPSTGVVHCIGNTLNPPATNGAGPCTTGTTVSNGGSYLVSTSQTLVWITTGSGYTDAAPLQALYLIWPPTAAVF